MKCRLTSSGGANQPPSGPPVDARLGPAAGRHELLPARPSGRRYRPARQRVWPTAGRPRPAAVGVATDSDTPLIPHPHLLTAAVRGRRPLRPITCAASGPGSRGGGRRVCTALPPRPRRIVRLDRPRAATKSSAYARAAYPLDGSAGRVGPWRRGRVPGRDPERPGLDGGVRAPSRRRREGPGASRRRRAEHSRGREARPVSPRRGPRGAR